MSGALRCPPGSPVTAGWAGRGSCCITHGAPFTSRAVELHTVYSSAPCVGCHPGLLFNTVHNKAQQNPKLEWPLAESWPRVRPGAAWPPACGGSGGHGGGRGGGRRGGRGEAPRGVPRAQPRRCGWGGQLTHLLGGPQTLEGSKIRHAIFLRSKTKTSFSFPLPKGPGYCQVWDPLARSFVT